MLAFILADSQPSTEESLRLEDLNYDCLREIFKLLDMPSQFSLMKAYKPFEHIFLNDLWFTYHKNGFDLDNAPDIAKQTEKFQSEVLKVIFKNFINIRGISLQIFNKCLEFSPDEQFKLVESLSITNNTYGIHHKILEMPQFSAFPNLLELKLDRVAIYFREKYTFPALKFLTMQNVIMLDDPEGDFLPNVLTPQLEKISLISMPFESMYYENFIPIKRCFSLKELNIGAEYLHDSRILTPVVNLWSLRILTLHSRNCFYFKSRDHCIFSRILKIVQQNPKKTVDGIQMNGMPQKNFFYSQYLKQIKNLNWMVGKIFHRKSNGGAEWTHDVPEVIVSFYDFIERNRNMDNVYVRDNIFHMRRLQTELTYNDKVHYTRSKKGLRRINIISDYKGLPDNPYIGELKEGYIKFVFKHLQ